VAGRLKAGWAKLRSRLAGLMNRIAGIKLRYKMFLVYILGGALPILLIGFLMIRGTTRILVEQAQREEITELEMIRHQVEEMTETVSTVTKYFYFDEQLEQIAAKQYENYQDVVRDYKEFTGFLDYTRYYNNLIAWINIYMDNQSLAQNSRFVKLTEEIRKEEWYAQVNARNGGAVWRRRPVPAVGYDALAMLRKLRTEKGEDVGILAVYIRPERFLTLLADRGVDSFVLLGGRTVVTDLSRNIALEEILEYVPEGKDGQIQRNVSLGTEEYVMTCETIALAESEDYLQILSFRSYRDILSQANRQNAASVLLFLLSALISVSIILCFSHSFSRRVERFRAQMQRAAEGHFELEANLGGNDEISSLYDYLGTMIGEIQRLLAEVYREKLHAERLTIQQKDAEFKMLASQINPHFLYNTLETIRMKARMSRQYDIEELVKMLAKIMRSYIQAGAEEARLRAEIELVESYLKIQQYRFEDRIRYQIYVESGLEECRILPLMIQPLVENSIIHGLEGKEGVGTISISAFSREEYTVIRIEDDGLGIPQVKLEQMRRNMDRYNEKGRHIGVSNVHQRVKLKYGEQYGVWIESGKGRFTRVEIFLPGKQMLGGTAYVQSDDN